MNPRSVLTAVAAGCAVSLGAQSASGAFVQFVTVVTPVTTAGVLLDQVQVYARFNGPTDTLVSASQFSYLGGACISDPYASFYHRDYSSYNGGILSRQYGSWNPRWTTSPAHRPFDSYLMIGGTPGYLNTTASDASWNSGGVPPHQGCQSCANENGAWIGGWDRPDLPSSGTLTWFNNSPWNAQGRVGVAPNTSTDVLVGQFVIDRGASAGNWSLTLGFNDGTVGAATQSVTAAFTIAGFTVFYRDVDGDGFGNSVDGTTSVLGCVPPAGYSSSSTDNCPAFSNPGQEDCNSNGIGDACEIGSSIVPDCDSDGISDFCEGVALVGTSSGLLPISSSTAAEFLFVGLSPAIGAAPRLIIEASADLGAATDGVVVTVDGLSAGSFFVADGTDCPASPNTAVVTYTVPNFNALIADGTLVVRASAFGVVNSAACGANGGIRFALSYGGLPSTSDCNSNGLLDSCEIGTAAAPDCNGNGKPDSCDIASGFSADCNGNGKPDSCDIASGLSSDINSNGRPDECSGEFVVGGTGYSSILTAAMQAPIGSTILVGPGVRHERVVIQRRVTVKSAAGPATTILDGTGIADSVVTITDPAASGVVFEGFTIRNGVSGTEWNLMSGGGMSIVATNATVRNCVFENNRSDFGGAAYLVQTAATFENCTFTNNSATTGGGALGIEVASGWTVRNCTFTGNSSLGAGAAAYGTGITGAFVGCTMRNNQAAASGGGIAWDSTLGGALLVDGCNLELNSALAGGGLAVVSGVGAIDLSSTRVCRNAPDNILGGVHDLGGNLVGGDCNGNGICDADEIASGAAFDCNGNGVLDSCDIASATSLDCNSNGVPDSCDIASGHSHDIDSNGIPDECSPDCDADARPDAWEIAQGFETDCNTNLQPDRCDITQNPALDCDHNGLIDSCEGASNPALDCNHNGVIDLCEIAQTPALDCNQNGRLDSCDLAGSPALDCDHNGRIDSCDIAGNGALDKNANGHLDSCELARGDLNLDGVVNAADLTVLLAFWGIPQPPVGDLNRDGIVAGADLSILLGNWGTTP